MGHNFDGIISSTKRYIGIAGEKAGEALSYSKLQLEKAEIKGKMRDKFAELGKFCYKMHETGDDYSGNMKKVIQEIKDLEEKLRDTDEALKIPKTCPLCGEKNDPDNSYCCKCGEKL